MMQKIYLALFMASVGAFMAWAPFWKDWDGASKAIGIVSGVFCLVAAAAAVTNRGDSPGTKEDQSS